MKTHSYITLGAQFGPVKTWRFAKREAILRSLPVVSVSHSLGAASGHATERGMRGFAKQNFQLLKICEGCVKVRAWKYHLWNDICIYVFLCHVFRYTTLVAGVHYSDVNSCLSAIDPRLVGGLCKIWFLWYFDGTCCGLFWVDMSRGCMWSTTARCWLTLPWAHELPLWWAVDG